MTATTSVPLFDLVLCISQAVDLVSPVLVNHHRRVGYITLALAEELKLSAEERKQLALAAILHDIGGLTRKSREDALAFEYEAVHGHAQQGYALLKSFAPFVPSASYVRFHHVSWANGAGAESGGEAVPMGSHVLHLADRVAVMLQPQEHPLRQVERIRGEIQLHSGAKFAPRLVEAFHSLATKEYFWLDAATSSLETLLKKEAGWGTMTLNDDELLEMSMLFRRLIDFRSRFTHTHSSGVAACAEALARWALFSERERRTMRLAGYLHDLGKLSVPAEVLEKPAKLTPEEFCIIRGHTYHTDRVLYPISALETARIWGALHHERLDGAGYPFHLRGSELTVGSRIMAVVDVFVALTEDRPYRKGMTRDETLGVLQKMAEGGGLDPDIVALLKREFDGINTARVAAQADASQEYRQFQEDSD